MISLDMLQSMKPEDAAYLADILGRFDCLFPATPCNMCPYKAACNFIDMLLIEMKERSKT